MLKKKQVIFDLGGSGARYSFDDLQTYESISFEKPNKEHVLNFIAKIANENDVDEIYMSAPGMIDPKKGIISGKAAIYDWTSNNIYDEIKLLLNKKNTNIYVDNDGNCSLLGNIHKYGNAVHSAVSIVIGSGIGGAFYSNGMIQRGYHNAMCELGYAQVIGIKNHDLSKLISTKALCKKINEKYNVNYNGKQIFDLYEKNKENIINDVNDWLNNISLFIYNVIWWFDPEVIFVGGAISANRIFQDKLLNLIDNLFAKTSNDKFAKVVFSPNGNETNLLGASLLEKYIK